MDRRVLRAPPDHAALGACAVAERVAVTDRRTGGHRRALLWLTPPWRATLATMIPFAELIGPEAIQSVATPANARLGRELAAADGVEVTATSPGRVEARVGGGRSGSQRRRVALWSDEDGLSWSCTCTNDPHLFCKHLVAAAVNARSSTAP